MCPYLSIAALQIGPGAADAAGLAVLLLAYAWRVLAQARRHGWGAAPLGLSARS